MASELTSRNDPSRFKNGVSPAGRKQRYRPVWEAEFKGWLTACPNNIYLAFCRVCKCRLQAHKKDIYRHSISNKHTKNLSKINEDIASKIEYQPFDDYIVFETNAIDEKILFSEIQEPDPSIFFKANQKSSPESSRSSHSPKITPDAKEQKFVSTTKPTPAAHIERCTRWCCQYSEAPPYYEDSYTIFGKFVSDEMRFADSELTRQKLKMQINTILYEASIGKYDTSNDVKPLKNEEFIYTNPQISFNNDDQISSFGKYIATELKSMSNPSAKRVAKMKICNTLCEMVYKV